MYDIIIIGSGPAGYVAAIRAGQVGLKCAIVERNTIGGMCLNWGCIPSKSMLESLKLYQKVAKDGSRFGIEGIDKKSLSFNWNKAVKRGDGIIKRLTGGVEFLLKKWNVDIIQGEAKIVSQGSVLVENRLIEAKSIIIATGSSSPKIESTVQGLIAEPKELFKERDIPENIVVAGGNPVAIELAQAFGMMDKKVTVVIPGDRIMARADKYISSFILNKLKKDKIDVIFGVQAQNMADNWKDGKIDINGKEILCDLIVNASDRKANLIASDVDIDVQNGFISTDDNFLTSVPNIYAIGDVNGLSMFAHVGSAQGLHVVNHLMGIDQKLDMNKIPLNMYTVPEAAQIGMTEDEIIEAGFDYKASEFPLSANGKAQTEGATEGFLRILSDNKYGEVLGVQIVAPNATDMINEASAYMQLESTVYDIAKTVHTHPTVSEVFMEAGFEAVDKAIHK